jgi:hypothetical protein
MKNKVLFEELAELEHEQWIEWTSYMLNNLTKENIQRWKRQLEIKYSDLTEKERWSDRRWAEKVLELVARSK